LIKEMFSRANPQYSKWDQIAGGYPLPRLAGGSQWTRAWSFLDFRAFGLTKAAYSVRETLEVLSIGRSSLYEAIGRGELAPVKFGRKTLLYAADLAAFLAPLCRHGRTERSRNLRVRGDPGGGEPRRRHCAQPARRHA
jgi:excisionase family DNA binding protein